MTPEQKSAYNKGYAAGRRRKQREIRAEVDERERRAFRERAFLALLPALIVSPGWTMEGKKCTNGEDRVRLAWAISRYALTHRPY